MAGEIAARIYASPIGWRDGVSDPDTADKAPAVMIFDGEFQDVQFFPDQRAIYVVRTSCPLPPVLDALRTCDADVMSPYWCAEQPGSLLRFLRVADRCHVFEARPWTIFRKDNYYAPRIDGLVEVLERGFPISPDEDPMLAFFGRINPTLVDPFIDRLKIERENEQEKQQKNATVSDLPAENFVAEIKAIVRTAHAAAIPCPSAIGRIYLRLTVPAAPVSYYPDGSIQFHSYFGEPRPSWVGAFDDKMTVLILPKLQALVVKARYHRSRKLWTCTGPEPSRQSSWQVRDLPGIETFEIEVGCSDV